MSIILIYFQKLVTFSTQNMKKLCDGEKKGTCA